MHTTLKIQKRLRICPSRNGLNETRAWLLDPADPGVRAQALIHLEGRPRDDPAVKVAQEESLRRGSVAKIIDGLLVASDIESLWNPKYGSPYHRLIALAEMGAPKSDLRIMKVLEKVLEVFAKPDGGFGRKDSHLCITGNIARAAIHFGRSNDPRVERGIEWLLAHQRADGGWNCFPEDEPGSTLDSWEPLAALGMIPASKRSSDVRSAISRAVEFFLGQRLGVEAGYEPWCRIHFPRHYYYDFLLGLELATSLGNPHDDRLRPALDLLLSKRGVDGRWVLDMTHPDVDPEGDPPYKPIWANFLATVVRLEVEPPEAPSRWATLEALRVLQKIGDAHAR